MEEYKSKTSEEPPFTMTAYSYALRIKYTYTTPPPCEKCKHYVLKSYTNKNKIRKNKHKKQKQLVDSH